MEITEKERLLLVQKKEEICGLTLWILENVGEPRNSVQIKKNITMILSLLSMIASYSSPKGFNLNVITQFAESVFARLRTDPSKLMKFTKDSGWRTKGSGTFRYFGACRVEQRND